MVLIQTDIFWFFVFCFFFTFYFPGFDRRLSRGQIMRDEWGRRGRDSMDSAARMHKSAVEDLPLMARWTVVLHAPLHEDENWTLAHRQDVDENEDQTAERG